MFSGIVERDKIIKCAGDLLLLAFVVRVGSNIGDGISISGNDLLFLGMTVGSYRVFNILHCCHRPKFISDRSFLN